jgi:hypothetical protein
MRLLGNYAYWIKQEWIDYIMSNPGTTRIEVPEEYVKKANELGFYQDTSVRHEKYIDEDGSFPFEIDFPIKVKGYENSEAYKYSSDLWFVKVMPGQLIPMHIDQPHPKPHTIRFWMALQDYQQGHVFVYENQMITNYKKGDLFLYDDPNAVHGSCNIGFSPRIIFNLSIYGDMALRFREQMENENGILG